MCCNTCTGIAETVTPGGAWIVPSISPCREIACGHHFCLMANGHYTEANNLAEYLGRVTCAVALAVFCCALVKPAPADRKPTMYTCTLWSHIISMAGFLLHVPAVSHKHSTIIMDVLYMLMYTSAWYTLLLSAGSPKVRFIKAIRTGATVLTQLASTAESTPLFSATLCCWLSYIRDCRRILFAGNEEVIWV